MIKTNEQVYKYALRTINTIGHCEKLHTRFLNYFFKNDLTTEQCSFLDEVKNRLNGQSNMNGYYIDQGYPMLKDSTND